MSVYRIQFYFVQWVAMSTSAEYSPCAFVVFGERFFEKVVVNFKQRLFVQVLSVVFVDSNYQVVQRLCSAKKVRSLDNYAAVRKLP